MGKKNYKTKERPSNEDSLLDLFVKKNLLSTTYRDKTYRSGRLDLHNGYSLHILVEVVPPEQSYSDRTIWCWTLTKDSQGGLAIDKIFKPENFTELQKLKRTVLSWPRYKNSSVPLNPLCPTPFPRSLAPTRPPKPGSKGRSWLKRPPEHNLQA